MRVKGQMLSEYASQKHFFSLQFCNKYRMFIFSYLKHYYDLKKYLLRSNKAVLVLLLNDKQVIEDHHKNNTKEWMMVTVT